MPKQYTNGRPQNVGTNGGGGLPNESGSIIIDYIQEQPETIQDGLLALFSADVDSFFMGDKIYIDQLGADQEVAKAKTPSAKADIIEPKGILDFEVEAPKYSLKIPFNIRAGKDVRLAGQAPTDDIDKQAILGVMLKNRVLVMINRTKRAMMKQAAQIFQTGKIAFSKEDAGLADADFKYSPELFYDYTTKWVNADGTINQNTDPIKDIRDRISLIYDKSSVSEFDVLLDGTAYDGLLKNEKVLKFADTQWIEILRFAPKEMQADGRAYCGTHFIDGRKVDFYLFNGTYRENGVSKKYLNDGQVVILPKNGGKYKVCFAGVDMVSELDESLKEVSPTRNITLFGDRKAVDVWIETIKEDNTAFLQFTSRPVLCAVSRDTHGSFNVKAKA